MAARKSRLRGATGAVIEALEERRMLAIDFDYETPPRFAKVDAYTGLAGDPSLLNVPNTFNYAHQLDPSTGVPIGYQITLTADFQGGILVGSPSWTLSGGVSTNARSSNDVSPTFKNLDLGSDFVQNFSVTLSADVQRFAINPITHLPGFITTHETVQRTITLRDILIVSMGDSESAGEGNPEINNSSAAPPFGQNGSPGVWEDSGDSVNSTVALTHKLGHRSTKAYAAQAARRLEDGDLNGDGQTNTPDEIAFKKHNAVTFVHVAMTGASVDKGLLGREYPNGLNDDGSQVLVNGTPVNPLPQMDQIVNIVGTRPIDSLMFSIGVNETNFGDQLVKLLTRVESNTFAGQTSELSIPGFNTFDDIKADVEHRLSHLPEQYRRLNEAIRSRLNVSRVFMFDYPSPLMREPNSYSTIAYDDIISDFENDLMKAGQDLFDHPILGGINVVANLAKFIEAISSFGGPSPTPPNSLPIPPGTVIAQAIKLVIDAAPSASTLSDKFNLSHDEMQFADQNILQPLSRMMQDSARLLGWTFVGDDDDPFVMQSETEGRGYGGKTETRPASQQWFVKFQQSLDQQGDIKGTMHPNLLAQTRMADWAVENLKRPAASFISNNGPDGTYQFDFQFPLDSSRPNRVRARGTSLVDTIDTYQWDMNYDGNPANFQVDATGTIPIYPNAVTAIPRLIGLRVVDSSGRMSDIVKTLVSATPSTVPATTALGPIYDPAAFIDHLGQLQVRGFNSGLTASNGGDEDIFIRRQPNTTNRIEVEIKGGGFTSSFFYRFNDNLFNRVVVESGNGNDSASITSGLTITPASGVPYATTDTPREVLEGLFHGGLGNDTMTASSGNDILSDVSGGGDDSMSGGAGDDLVEGGSGDDVLNGNDGNDTVNGSTGNDTINGGNGNDALGGGGNGDTMNGGGGNDIVLGGSGDDVLHGSSGDDLIDGGTGNDTATGDNGDDKVMGGDDDDLLLGNAGIDDVLGGDGNDILGAPETFGLAGDSFDIRFLGTGPQPWWAGFGLLWKDEFDGGSGINGVAVSGTEGDDNILIHREPGELHFILNGVDQVLELSNCQTIIVHAGKGDDTVVMDASGGERWKAEFYGEDGNDHLVGSAMDDLLDGGKGKDTLEGGPGHDTMIGDQGNDLFISDGNDVLFKNKRKDDKG